MDLYYELKWLHLAEQAIWKITREWIHEKVITNEWLNILRNEKKTSEEYLNYEQASITVCHSFFGELIS